MNGDKEYQRYESVMAWPRRRSVFTRSLLTNNGNINEVVMEPKNADTLHIGYTPFHADEPQKVRQILKFKDNDHFVWTVNVKQGDDWNRSSKRPGCEGCQGPLVLSAFDIRYSTFDIRYSIFDIFFLPMPATNVEYRMSNIECRTQSRAGRIVRHFAETDFIASP